LRQKAGRKKYISNERNGEGRTFLPRKLQFNLKNSHPKKKILMVLKLPKKMYYKRKK
jgi:hypothetical protein